MVVILTLMACTDQAQFRHDADVATCAWKEDCYGEDFNVCLETPPVSKPSRRKLSDG